MEQKRTPGHFLKMARDNFFSGLRDYPNDIVQAGALFLA